MLDDDNPPPSDLTSDELGELGEAEFQRLSALGQLTANKAVRDRAGWDFLVHAPAEDTADATLDERTILWTSYVQVKAAWSGRRRRVRLTLSAAEKLAKHHDATFVAAFLYDRTDPTQYDLYMVELTGPRLAQIMKDLRVLQRDGGRAINETHVYLHLKDEERLPVPSGQAVRERLAKAHRAAGASGYSVMKTHELATIGFSELRGRGVVTLHDIDHSSLFNVLLGKQTWKASLSHFVETRFDIDLPMRDAPSGVGLVKFSPKPQASCQLTVTSKGLKGQLTFTGGHHKVTLPGPSGLETRSLCCFNGFDIERAGGRIRMDSVATDTRQATYTLGEWRRFWRLFAACRNHSTIYTLRSPLFDKPVNWTFAAKPGEIPEEVSNTLIAVEALCDLADELDLTVGPTAMESITRDAKAVVMARHFGVPGRQSLVFKLPTTETLKPGYERVPLKGVFVDFFDIATHRVAVAVQVTMAYAGETDENTGEDLWESQKPRRLAVRTIGRSEAEFAAFTEEAKTLARRDRLFLGDIDDDFLQSALGSAKPF